MKKTFSISETPEFSGKAVAALAAGLCDLSIFVLLNLYTPMLFTIWCMTSFLASKWPQNHNLDAESEYLLMHS